ncbi:MAG: hypothetical protein H6707_05875 [Deltaproteobacteria bacterium]|nr:hypothetical protein [Deltaproteobacteria bacterium]
MRAAAAKPTAVLQKPADNWWDQAFTELLLDLLPEAPRQLLLLGRGLAAISKTLLPHLPDTQVSGFSDRDVEQSEAELAKLPLSQRVSLNYLDDNQLDLPAESHDSALCLLFLCESNDPQRLLAQVSSALQPRATAVFVEPDNLGQRFYFDGALEQFNELFNRLCRKARVALQPTDIAIGPQVPKTLLGQGFTAVRFRLHMIHSGHGETARAFFGRLQRLCTTTAERANLPADCDELVACQQEVNRLLYAGMPKRIGHCCHAVPVFAVTATRP